MGMDASKDFFISYTSADQHWAEWIGWQLEEAGYTTILQAWDFHAGGNFVLDMDTATKQAKRTIAVLSPDYLDSRFTPSEWATTFRRDPKGELGLLVPVRVRPCTVEGLLGPIVYIDLVGQKEQVAQATLLAAVKRQRHKPSKAPAFPSIAHMLSERPSFPGVFPRIWNIPYPRNAYFSGREELLSQLAAALRLGQTTALSQPQAISGLGGIGKTQIALEYAYRYYQDYQAVLWSRADTTEALISGFAAFAELLQLPQKDEKDQLIAVETVKEWLKTHDHWLLILDNADELTVVRDFLPTTGQGHTLLTTRAASTGGLANRIEVEILDQDMGALFVLRRAGMLAADASLDQAEPRDVALARELVQEMGGLPLALDQAGAYIEETHDSLSDYLKLYRQYRVTLLKERGGLVLDHPEPVATTWSLSFEKVKQSNPAAADLLRVCAFLQPDAIPEEILLEGASYLGQEIQQFSTNPLTFGKALKALFSYSLIQRNPMEHLLSIHRLVQAVLKDEMDQTTYHLWADRTVQAVGATLPEVDHRTKGRYERCLSHAQGCAGLIEQLHLTSSVATQLLYQTALYLHNHARYVEARQLYEQALHIREQAHGPDDPQVASLLHGLASLYTEQGKYAQAGPLDQRALHIWEQAHGPEHSKVASSLVCLAEQYREQGKYAQAKPLYERALHIWEQAHGPEYSHVAYPLHGLASLYTEQGKYTQAEPLYERALHILVQTLGPEHPKVARLLNDLAEQYREQGKYAQAEPLYERALHIFEQTLEPKHPMIAHPLHGLASLYTEQGKYAQAEPLYERALHIFEQAHGSEHSHVAYPLDGLASLYTEQGKYTQAKPLYERALHILVQVLGPQHRLTQKTAKNYASLLHTMGRETEAHQLEARFFS